jgi:hypothetical protein
VAGWDDSFARRGSVVKILDTGLVDENWRAGRAALDSYQDVSAFPINLHADIRWCETQWQGHVAGGEGPASALLRPARAGEGECLPGAGERDAVGLQKTFCRLRSVDWCGVRCLWTFASRATLAQCRDHSRARLPAWPVTL